MREARRPLSRFAKWEMYFWAVRSRVEVILLADVFYR
jgi:hypothetical protein